MILSGGPNDRGCGSVLAESNTITQVDRTERHASVLELQQREIDAFWLPLVDKLGDWSSVQRNQPSPDECVVIMSGAET